MPACCAELGQQLANQREWGDDVGLEYGAVGRRVEVGEGGQRAGTQGAGVVHEQGGAAQASGRLGQVAPMVGVGDVARDRHVSGPGKVGEGGGQSGLVPGIAHDRPTLFGKGVGELAAEPLRGAGDDCDGHLGSPGSSWLLSFPECKFKLT